MKNLPVLIAAAALAVYLLNKNKGSKNILIGDSQTPYIAKNSKKFKLLSNKPGADNLWQGGTGVSWLINALKNKNTDNTVTGVGISIGTNGGFNINDNIKELFNELKRVFPKAKFYTIPGSWGWGGNKNKTSYNVLSYYKLFAPYSTVLNTAIGGQDPHANLPVYKVIGNELDNK